MHAFAGSLRYPNVQQQLLRLACGRLNVLVACRDWLQCMQGCAELPSVDSRLREDALGSNKLLILVLLGKRLAVCLALRHGLQEASRTRE